MFEAKGVKVTGV